MIKYIHILLVSLATLGVVCGSIQLPSTLSSSQSIIEISDFEENNHSIFYFLFENDSSEEQNDAEDSSDLDPQEENNIGIEIATSQVIPFRGLSNAQVNANLIAQLAQVHPVKRFLLFQNFKIYC